MGAMMEMENQRKISVTGICEAVRSLKHFHWSRVLKRRSETAAMREGTQVHMLVLEPEKFYRSYCTDMEIPAGKVILTTVDDIKTFAADCGVSIKGKKDQLVRWASNFIVDKQIENVIIYDDWLETNTRNKDFISKVKWEALHYMRESILDHRFTQKHLEKGWKEVEISGFIDGWDVRGRADWVIDDPSLPYVIIIDVKKTVSSDFHRFRNTVTYDNLYVQAALYSHLFETKFQRPCLFAWLATEGVAPFITEAYACNQASLDAGMVRVRDALKKLTVAYETNYWPGHSKDGLVQSMDITKSAFDKAAEIEIDLVEVGDDF